MGRESRAQFEQEFGGLLPDQRVQEYVNDVGQRLASQTSRPDLPWEFRVLNSDQINAFALPGGFIYISRGLLQQLENEAQLASILGHEIGHVTNRHVAQQIQRSQLAQGGVLAAGIFGGGDVANAAQVVGGLTLMKFSRDQEREADLSGLQYMTRQRYDPAASVSVMEVLRKASGGGGGTDFFSSHPSPKNREEYLNEAVERSYGTVITRWFNGEQEFEENVLDRLDRLGMLSPLLPNIVLAAMDVVRLSTHPAIP